MTIIIYVISTLIYYQCLLIYYSSTLFSVVLIAVAFSMGANIIVCGCVRHYLEALFSTDNTHLCLPSALAMSSNLTVLICCYKKIC